MIFKGGIGWVIKGDICFRKIVEVGVGEVVFEDSKFLIRGKVRIV